MVKVKITDIAKEFEIETKRLREIIEEADLDITRSRRVITEEEAESLRKLLNSIDLEEEPKKKEIKKGKDKEAEAVEKKEGIMIPQILTVKQFAELIDQPVTSVISILMKNSMFLNQNESIDFDTAAIIAAEFEVDVIPELKEEEVQLLDLDKLLQEQDQRKLKIRPPVVSVMGHVDHGKTSLLDFIRKTTVASGEAGGITQSIGAYQVEHNKHKITFLDTPGHEAFTAMRARGAKATDIAILVVAAEEGVKPQTIEAIDHAKDAGIPIIVAINKIDKPGANIEKVKKELSEHELIPEDWGGKTPCVGVSAKTGQGIDELLEVLILTAEIEELKANPKRAAIGMVIETHLDPNYGPVATVLVKAGTLHKQDTILVGKTFGRVRVMHDYQGKNIEMAPPSTPVMIAGLQELPQVGDILQTMPDIKKAKSSATKKASEMASLQKQKVSLFTSTTKVKEGKIKVLKLIVCTDTKGSLEAIRGELDKITGEHITIKVIHADIGAVTNGDVLMAKASMAPIVAFNVSTPRHVAMQAEQEGVEISHYDVIYHLIEDVKKTASGLFEPEKVEVVTGHGKILKIFFRGKKEMIVGVKIEDGNFMNHTSLRIIRDGETIGEGKITALKIEKEAVNQVAEGHECGVKYQGSVKLLEGDTLETYKVEEKTVTVQL